MNKILLILQREYLIRVKKKSFIVMTFLGPLLMAALMIVPIVLASIEDVGKKNIAVLDESGLFAGKFESGDNLLFEYVQDDLETAKAFVLDGVFDGLLYVPETQLSLPSNAEFFSVKQASVSARSYVRNVMKAELENQKLLASGIDPEIIKSVRTTVNIVTIKLDQDGTESRSYTEVQLGLGMVLAIIIYFFIFMFGSQVMRGVIEEKTNRIVEVIVSSVKPFQLMMGKITGIALVGLTQFVLWVVLTFSIYGVFTLLFGSVGDAAVPGQIQTMMNQTEAISPQIDDMGVAQIFEVIHSINFGLILSSFAFFFLAGYLLYASFFAAIGAAVDNEADTQQFMLPVSLPLILGIILSSFIANNPDGPLAFWLSVFPLTSPIVMMLRLPFGVPVWELLLSMVVLIAGFILTTWMAAKIYRTGILMYGKKPSYAELWKWIRYQ
ncbi:MAG: ABC transporter permease [Bacteroidales bacterium]|jgi:ABC-2 type transport system permease protein|nr:ABC transporter permease [Bacteroidales bacterium]MDD3700481.1 ABC transporter permease [Bacteroidales bacterium]MDY0369869.1 ABC transporter permease [Bacteroidales bacterium]